MSDPEHGTMRVELYREKVLRDQFKGSTIERYYNGPTGDGGGLLVDGDPLPVEEVYQSGGYRWRIWASSDVIGASTEGYGNRLDMVHNLLFLTGGRLKRRRDGLFLERRSIQRGQLVRYPVKDLTGDGA